ncbi:MAG: Gfo/Idh/MocA family oxidoreductase [Kiritimatiellae bacterium]|nr:Gfo/Idh/MocA family oxidoreductase [Kiritimatiellia bacterium]
MNRRTFLQTTAAGVAASVAVRGAETATANEPLRLGLIGCGWYGGVLLDAAHRAGGVEVASLCDVDARHLEDTARKIAARQNDRRPRTFKHYEEMLSAGGLDAVIIATPPHWHALQFLAALEAGLHVYLEKPLAYDIRECQAMVRAAEARPKQVVQIGFQRRQSPAFQQVREFIGQGGLGTVRQLEAQIHYAAGLLDSTPQDPPPELDWELWCGPGPKLRYSPQVGHKAWRLEREVGHGHLADWGIHLIDAARVLLTAAIPRRVAASGALVRYAGRITTPDTMSAWFEFGDVPLVWRHRLWGAQEHDPDTQNGIFIYGDEGTVFVTDQRWIFTPRGKPAERKVTEAKADLAREHMQEFLDAVRGRRPAGCSTRDGAASTIAVKLAMIAMDLGRTVEWDANREQAVGEDAVARMKREYRAPWRHPWSG